MKTMLNLCVVIVSMVFYAATAWGATESGVNSFFGLSAGANITSGSSDTFIGADAGFSNTTGSNNTFMGVFAGLLNTAGSSNVFLGFSAGYGESGSNKLYIDNCFTGGACDSPLIYGEFDNRIVRIDGTLVMVTVATPSDVRYKKDIHPLESSLDTVMKLRGVTYAWKKEELKGAGFRDGRQIGLIAQEVEKVLPEVVQTDDKGYKTLSYDKLAPVLIEAVKEQQKGFEMQERLITEQQKAMNEKDARIGKLEKALDAIEKRLTVMDNSPKNVASR